MFTHTSKNVPLLVSILLALTVVAPLTTEAYAGAHKAASSVSTAVEQTLEQFVGAEDAHCAGSLQDVLPGFYALCQALR
jgi:hypothetical protein